MKVVDMTQILSKEDKASHKPPKVGHKGKRKEDIYTNFCEKKKKMKLLNSDPKLDAKEKERSQRN